MSTSLAIVGEKNGECRTVGCIAGMAMALYPEEVRQAISEQLKIGNDYRSTGGYAAIATVLGLDEHTGQCLFFGLGSNSRRKLSELTPQEVTAAIARAEQGVTGRDIWAANETRGCSEGHTADVPRDEAESGR